MALALPPGRERRIRGNKVVAGQRLGMVLLDGEKRRSVHKASGSVSPIHEEIARVARSRMQRVLDQAARKGAKHAGRGSRKYFAKWVDGIQKLYQASRQMSG
jgi:hypothetical protein